MKRLILILITGLLLGPAAQAEVLYSADSALDRHHAERAMANGGAERVTTGEVSKAHLEATDALCDFAQTVKRLPSEGGSDERRRRASGTRALANRAHF